MQALHFLASLNWVPELMIVGTLVFEIFTAFAVRPALDKLLFFRTSSGFDQTAFCQSENVSQGSFACRILFLKLGRSAYGFGRETQANTYGF